VSGLAITVIMAVAALLALGLLVRAVRQARAAGDLDASTALTLGMAWLISAPVALVAISGGVTRRPDVFGELVTIFPGWYLSAVDLAMLVVVALATVLLLKGLGAERVPVHAAGVFAILVWAVAQLASGLHGGRLLSPTAAVLLMCLIAATVLPRGRGASLGAGIFGVTLAIASGLLAVFRYDVAFVVPCEEACSGLGLTGILPNENLLAIGLTASIPFAYLGFRGYTRYWFTLYLAGMAIATGSRMAVVASVVIVGALLIARPRLDADRRTPVRAAAAWLVLAGAVCASVYVVGHDWKPTELTDRGTLWSVASDHIDESPWFGYGPEKWAGLYALGEIPRAAQRSTHNQWMDVLLTAGWVGAALFVCMVVAMLWSSGHARAGVLLTLATILMIGTTEGAWSVASLDALSFSLVALILTGETKARETLSTGLAKPVQAMTSDTPSGAAVASARRT
jgi:O-antigen ligase